MNFLHFTRGVLLIWIICIQVFGYAQGQTIPVPFGYSIIDSAFGDLDKDGVKELAVAYNTSTPSDSLSEGVVRELIVYKLRTGKWRPLHRSKQALLGSRDGGMMGDPFGRIAVAGGLLIVEQNGGSSWKWSNTDKYRFRGQECLLVGFTSVYGKLCEYWESADFNLATGKLMFTKEFERCGSGKGQVVYKRLKESFYRKGIKISLENRTSKSIKLISPKFKQEVYVSIGPS